VWRLRETADKVETKRLSELLFRDHVSQEVARRLHRVLDSTTEMRADQLQTDPRLLGFGIARAASPDLSVIALLPCGVFLPRRRR